MKLREMKQCPAAVRDGAALYPHQDYIEGSQRNNYLSLLGLPPQETYSLIELVSQGFSFQEVDNLRRNTRLTPDEFSALIQITPRTLSRRKETSRLMPDESDRLLRASRIFGRTLDLFEGDTDGALHWLRSPHLALGPLTPLQLSQTEIGAREVERLIGQLEHGVYP